MTDREKNLEEALRVAGVNLLFAATEFMKKGDDENAKIMIDASDKLAKVLSYRDLKN